MHTIKLETEHLKTVMGALAELPWRVSNPVMAEIDKQLRQAQSQDPGDKGSGSGDDEQR